MNTIETKYKVINLSTLPVSTIREEKEHIKLRYPADDGWVLAHDLIIKEEGRALIERPGEGLQDVVLVDCDQRAAVQRLLLDQLHGRTEPAHVFVQLSPVVRERLPRPMRLTESRAIDVSTLESERKITREHFQQLTEAQATDLILKTMIPPQAGWKEVTGIYAGVTCDQMAVRDVDGRYTVVQYDPDTLIDLQDRLGDISRPTSSTLRVFARIKPPRKIRAMSILTDCEHMPVTALIEATQAAEGNPIPPTIHETWQHAVDATSPAAEGWHHVVRMEVIEDGGVAEAIVYGPMDDEHHFTVTDENHALLDNLADLLEEHHIAFIKTEGIIDPTHIDTDLEHINEFKRELLADDDAGCSEDTIFEFEDPRHLR